MKTRSIFAQAMIKTDMFLKKTLLNDSGEKTVNEQLAELIALKILLKKEPNEADYKTLGILKVKYGVKLEQLLSLIHK